MVVLLPKEANTTRRQGVGCGSFDIFQTDRKKHPKSILLTRTPSILYFQTHCINKQTHQTQRTLPRSSTFQFCRAAFDISPSAFETPPLKKMEVQFTRFLGRNLPVQLVTVSRHAGLGGQLGGSSTYEFLYRRILLSVKGGKAGLALRMPSRQHDVHTHSLMQHSSYLFAKVRLLYPLLSQLLLLLLQILDTSLPPS
jgi:hypothetical protein